MYLRTNRRVARARTNSGPRGTYYAARYADIAAGVTVTTAAPRAQNLLTNVLADYDESLRNMRITGFRVRLTAVQTVAFGPTTPGPLYAGILMANANELISAMNPDPSVGSTGRQMPWLWRGCFPQPYQAAPLSTAFHIPSFLTARVRFIKPQRLPSNQHFLFLCLTTSQAAQSWFTYIDSDVTLYKP